MLSVEGELSYRCPVCGAERAIVATGEVTTTSEPSDLPNEVSAGESGQMIHELERLARLHDSGALTDTEFQAAKARLLGTG